MVDSQYQHTGTGSRIITEIILYLKKSNYNKIRLGVDKNNPQSYGFWKRTVFFQWILKNILSWNEICSIYLFSIRRKHMERFLTFTVNKNSGFHTVGQVLRSQGGLTKIRFPGQNSAHREFSKTGSAAGSQNLFIREI